MNRRDFVKTSGLAIAATAVGGPALAYAGGSDRIKVGLIGCGGRGTGAASQALQADPGIVLWSMGDIFAERIESSHKYLADQMAELDDEGGAGTKWRNKLQVADDRRFVGFDAYQHVIDSGVDAVILTTFPHFRPAQIKAAVAAGKHIFAEKPVAVDGPGIRSVLESSAEAQRKNLALQVGFCWRYHAAMRAGLGKVLDGSIGDVTTVQTTYHTGTLQKHPRQPSWSDMEFEMRNWWHFTWLSGDHIVEQAIHSIDRMAWALGDMLPARVNCLGGRAARSGPEHGDVFDHFAAVYEYDDGRRAFHTCRQIDGCPSDNSDYVYGTKGAAYINGWTPNRIATRDLSGKELWHFEGEVKDMYQQEHDELWASIRAGKPNNDCVRGARSNLMAIMARMAAYTGQTITWDQALNSQEHLGPTEYSWSSLPAPTVAIPGQTKFS
ncbi:MAG: Gfo/Idh/MocA family oxidoreductase [Phycisphaerales bacterium]|nr:Gfo/Idh/MocA family oxidoreductase [Phycisphaerales bacterium]